MAILAIDAAAGQCAVGLLLDNGQHFQAIEIGLRGQSQRLLPMIEALLKEAGMDYASLCAVAVTTGPGSFTGLRVGLAAAQGLSLALGIPAIGIDSFTAFALGNNIGLPTMIVIESRRAELYWQVISENDDPLTEPACDLPQTISEHFPAQSFVLAGDGAVHLQPYTVDRPDITTLAASAGANPVSLAMLAKSILVKGDPIPAAHPFYLRQPDAKASP